MSTPTESLTFDRFREANMRRLPLFKNRKGEPAHEKPDGSDWSLSDWLVALAGEVGEAMSLAKAHRRGDWQLDDPAPSGTPSVDGRPALRRDMIGRELADIVTYADILGAQVGAPLEVLGGFHELEHRVAREPARVLPVAVYWRTLLSHLGALELAVDYREASPQAGAGFKAVHSDRIATALRCLVWNVAELARLHELSLAEWVVRKFDEVSRRVGCDVFLGPVPPRWDEADPATFRDPPEAADGPPATAPREGSRSLRREGSRIPDTDPRGGQVRPLAFSVRVRAVEAAEDFAHTLGSCIRFRLGKPGDTYAEGSFWLRDKGLTVEVEASDSRRAVFEVDLHEFARVAIAHVEGSMRPVDMDFELLQDVSLWMAGQLTRGQWGGVSGSLLRDMKRSIDEHLARVRP